MPTLFATISETKKRIEGLQRQLELETSILERLTAVESVVVDRKAPIRDAVHGVLTRHGKAMRLTEIVEGVAKTSVGEDLSGKRLYDAVSQALHRGKGDWVKRLTGSRWVLQTNGEKQ